VGRVILSRAGSFYRVQCDPVEALPRSFARPSTYTNLQLARDTAQLLSEATGFPLVDNADKKGALHG
jgi:hypothetical protein